MISPSLPHNEKERQRAVEKYKLLDTLPEEVYDTITKVISSICNTPISLITLLDKERNYLKSHNGVPFNESPRKLSFCGHAINYEGPIMIIEDARKDTRFYDNPLVTEANAIFYAGVPLVNPEGYKLGTLCVFDTKPRKLNTKQQEALKVLAKQVVYLFEQRVKNQELIRLQQEVQERNQNLEKFAALVSHDLKSPLAQITSLIQLIEMESPGVLGESIDEYLRYIKVASASLRNYIDDMLDFYKSNEQSYEQKSSLSIDNFTNELKSICSIGSNVDWEVDTTLRHIVANKLALKQVLVNLITNAIKYNHRSHPLVKLTFKEDVDNYYISVLDNGRGIQQDHLDKIFDMFYTLKTQDLSGNQGTGVGLAMVKNIVDKLNGDIQVESNEGEGSNFIVTIPK